MGKPSVNNSRFSIKIVPALLVVIALTGCDKQQFRREATSLKEEQSRLKHAYHTGLSKSHALTRQLNCNQYHIIKQSEQFWLCKQVRQRSMEGEKQLASIYQEQRRLIKAKQDRLINRWWCQLIGFYRK